MTFRVLMITDPKAHHSYRGLSLSSLSKPFRLFTLSCFTWTESKVSVPLNGSRGEKNQGRPSAITLFKVNSVISDCLSLWSLCGPWLVDHKYIGNCFLHDFSNSTSVLAHTNNSCAQPSNLVLSSLLWPWVAVIQFIQEQQYPVDLISHPTNIPNCGLSVSSEMNCFIGAKLTNVYFKKQ